MRTVKQIASITIGASANADTGQIDTEEFHTLIAVITSISGAATGAYNLYGVDEANQLVPLITGTGATIGATVLMGLGREVGTSVAPVFRRSRVLASTIAAGALTLAVFGVADEPDNV